jgi:hypothetical protein
MKEAYIAVIGFYLAGFYCIAMDSLAVGVFFVIVASLILGVSWKDESKD